MTLVTELDLPAFDYTAPDFAADRYHGQLAQVRAQGWLARSPLAYLVLDREAGEFFLRSRAAAFPGRQIAEFFGITSGPLWDHIDTNILNLTGAQHRRLRALVGPAFTPRAAGRWRPVMRDLLAGLWTSVTPATACEFMAAVARPYPALTFASVLGAPAADASRLQEWSNLVQRQFDIVEFPAGTIVAVCAERANREGGATSDGGEEFDITAERDSRLLTFGAGAHFCLGINLARAELEEALTFLAPRMPGLALDGDPVLGGVEGIYGVDALPLRWLP
jgi:cytochrome P450